MKIEPSHRPLPAHAYQRVKTRRYWGCGGQVDGRITEFPLAQRLFKLRRFSWHGLTRRDNLFSAGREDAPSRARSTRDSRSRSASLLKQTRARVLRLRG